MTVAMDRVGLDDLSQVVRDLETEEFTDRICHVCI
jgi:hypothetical protein